MPNYFRVFGQLNFKLAAKLSLWVGKQYNK